MRSLALIALLLAGCATDAKLLAQNVDLRLQLQNAKEQLRQQQDYVAATEERDAQIQSDMHEAYDEMRAVMDDEMDAIRAQVRAEISRNCGA